LAVLPSRSSRQTTTLVILPLRTSASNRSRPGRSIVVPVKRSLYHATASAWAFAQVVRSASWLLVSWPFVLLTRM
jgi:hypothetical protein